MRNLKLPLDLDDLTKQILGHDELQVLKDARHLISMGIPGDTEGEKRAYASKNIQSQDDLSNLKYRIQLHNYEISKDMYTIREDIRQDLVEESRRYSKEDLNDKCLSDTKYSEYARVHSYLTSLVVRIDELMWILKSASAKF